MNAAFPGRLQCLPHESPAVLVVANFRGNGAARQGGTATAMGGSWHTDIEYEPLPIYFAVPGSGRYIRAFRRRLQRRWRRAPASVRFRVR